MNRPTHALCAVISLTLAASAAETSVPRQVAAPASDITAGFVRLPDPSATPTSSRAAIFPLRFARDARGAWSATIGLDVDRDGPLAIALLSPDAGTWKLSAAAPGGVLSPIADALVVERRTELVGDDLPGFVVDRHDVQHAGSGTWTLRVDAARAPHAPADGWLFARTAGELAIEAFVTTQRLVGGEPIGVVARATQGANVGSVRLVLETPSGERALAMLDDGGHEDGARGDGTYGALVPADLRGDVRARVEMRGLTAERAPFVRTALLSFPVLERATLLDGAASARLADDARLRFELAALPLDPTAARFHVSAEVWGRDASGALAPVCWLSRMQTPELRDGRWLLALEMDLAWLDVARVDVAEAALELRQVRVQDPETAVVFDRIDRIALETPTLPRSADPTSAIVTAQMLTGSSAIALGGHAPAILRPKPSIPALMLVHGYCSGGSIWPAADFTQPKVVFLDPNANRTHDQFAQLIDQRAQQSNLTTFGVVAHSQGGCAALHLLTYYTSALDFANVGRRIQSVATPYQGTPLASLGGFACGVNNDMTPSGAATWLAGIPSWARAEVHFWTTANSGSTNCNALTAFFLSDPEDGTVERFRGDLPGGNGMGHVTGWCHTTGMSFPANYTDHARNQAMDAAAAR